MSRDWTQKELKRASEYMKSHGELSYEEFCKALASEEFGDASVQQHKELDPTDGLLAMAYSSVVAEANGTADMTLDEINAEINLVRGEHVARRSTINEVENPAVAAMNQLQKAMEGEAEKAGLATEEAIESFVKEIRDE